VTRFVSLVLLLAACGTACAQEEAPARTLIPGKGVELTTARCVICHDATHITRTKLSRGEWEFNIKNMIERGAPIAPDEIAPILEYLALYYNRDVAPPAPAAAAGGDAITNLLNSNACTACHQTDKRVIGPSFREVAAKYANDNAAATTIARKIKLGGSGVWGNVPMPPNAGVSDNDLQQIVSWILRQK
jgi:cytochrome c